MHPSFLVSAQRQVEAVRNFKLLDIACACDDLAERLAYVAAFSAAALGGIERRTRKPFDSVIGDSYELETPEFALVGEQVDSDVGVAQVNGKRGAPAPPCMRKHNTRGYRDVRAGDWSLFTNSAARTCFHGLHITVDVTAYVHCCAQARSRSHVCRSVSGEG
jgi:hypothetical protein